MFDINKTNDVLIGGLERVAITIVEYDPGWPQRFEEHARRIRRALGIVALHIEHIGSTSVPGLAAKPIIDVLVVVPDSSDEPAYLPALESAGYQLRVREPDFHQHRMLRTPARDTHVHVYSAGCHEIERNILFRDRLRNNAGDLARYQRIKREMATQSWRDMNEYAAAKTDVIEDIIARASREQRV